MTESDFDQLPERFRLALFDLALNKHREETGQKSVELNLVQIATATGTPWTSLHRRYSAALIKLQHEARLRGLDLSDFLL